MKVKNLGRGRCRTVGRSDGRKHRFLASLRCQAPAPAGPPLVAVGCLHLKLPVCSPLGVLSMG